VGNEVVKIMDAKGIKIFALFPDFDFNCFRFGTEQGRKKSYRFCACILGVSPNVTSQYA
jgi:hypothetical protein